jgi:hypothetical protein
MSSFSTFANKGASLPKQERFYEDWSSGNHAVNNIRLHKERVKVENQRLKFTVRDSVADALRQSTERMSPPAVCSYRPDLMTTDRNTARTTGRTVISTGRQQRLDEEEEAQRLAEQMVEAQRQLEIEQLREEEEQSAKFLEDKLDAIVQHLRAHKKLAEQSRFEKPTRMSERVKQPYRVLVPHPIHHRAQLTTARLSGDHNPHLTERGVARQVDFLRKEARNPRILPRKTISEDSVTIAQNSKLLFEKKAW